MKKNSGIPTLFKGGVVQIAQWFFIPLGVILLAYFFKALVFNDLVCCIFSIFIVVLSTLVAVYYKKLRTSKS